jgi:hypothetical protein
MFRKENTSWCQEGSTAFQRRLVRVVGRLLRIANYWRIGFTTDGTGSHTNMGIPSQLC